MLAIVEQGDQRSGFLHPDKSVGGDCRALQLRMQAAARHCRFMFLENCGRIIHLPHPFFLCAPFSKILQKPYLQKDRFIYFLKIEFAGAACQS